ncbi:helix-turn-helix domain-containing protein [Streptomyces qaidamensis]|uniref:AraC-like ligand-binding domain-containing protein n=1 Tax=Streptomyces qaidamensis TaxID=1783515 RepID=UPI003659C28F
MSLPSMMPGGETLTSLDAWQELLGSRLAPMEAEPLGDLAGFYGRMYVDPVADLQLSLVSGSGQVVRRTPRLVQRSAGDLYKVGLQVRGRGAVRQDGRVAELSTGDLTVYDTARPYELIFDRDFEMLVLLVPRRRLAARVPDLDRQTATVIAGTSGSGAITSSLLHRLEVRSARKGPEAAYLTAAAIDLVAACLAGRGELDAPNPTDAVVLEAQRYIDDHLSDPELNPGQVAAAVHVSLRLLQKAFERRGTTVSGEIRERRLEYCWHDLADPRLAHQSVAFVAAARGLVDAAQFSRAFRRRYGTTPSAHRAERGVTAGSTVVGGRPGTRERRADTRRQVGEAPL